MKSSGTPPSLLKFSLLMLMLMSYTDTFVIGAPKGGHVVSGTASFTQDGNLTVITAGNRSVINYTGFDIGKNETVQFVQPGAHSTVLNRVTTPDPTNIFGRLESNGIVVISNPYGVFFENGSVVNVGGLVAGAGKISTADFTAGKIHFTDLNGDVRNDGVIAADNQIALMGAHVANTGSMTAAHGVAMMVSGPDVYVGDKNGNIFVQANGKARRAAVAATGPNAPSAGGVTNSGTVAAPRVVLGAGDMYSTAIVNSGLLQGRSIAVNAGKNGNATVGGTLDASSAHHASATGKGGNIDVLGGTVVLMGAHLNANGTAGGGNVRVGGDLHGDGTLAHATATVVDANTTIKANATGATGDGGTVVLWSDKQTVFEGSISAHGGSAGGNGGSAEVSSANALRYNGLTSLSGPAGTRGTLLLDPDNIIIDNVATGNTPLPLPVGGTVTVNFADTPANETISTTNLDTTLIASNVILDANNNIVVRASVAPTGNVGTSDLTLNAGKSIYIGDPGNVGTGAATTASITLGGGFTGNFNATGGSATTRTTGAAVFAMTTGSAISAPAMVKIAGGNFVGTGTIAGNTGAVTLGALTSHGGDITVDNHLSTAAGITANAPIDSTATAANTAGGNISLQAGNGLTLAGTTTPTVNATINASGNGTGDGGTVGLTAAKGDILTNSTANTITSNSPGTGSGGDITVTSTLGNVNITGGITAASIGTAAGAGHGGAVQLTANAGTVTAGTINTNVAGPGNATARSGQAGNVTLASSGLLTVGAINATSNAGAVAVSTTTGSGGTVLLTSSTGDIQASTINTFIKFNLGTTATAGDVTLNAHNALTVGAIDATGAGSSSGGAVSLTANNGALQAGTINNASAAAGNTVQLTSKGGAINVGAIDTIGTVGGNTGGAVTLGASGTGGNITATTITTGGTTATGGGNVQATASGTLGTGAINTSAAGTQAGTVQLTSVGNLTPGAITTTDTNGAGGNVSLTINTGSATATTLTLPNISTGASKTGAPATSGTVTINNNSTVTGSGITATGTLNTSGVAIAGGANASGGAIVVKGPGDINFTQPITANGVGTGAAGAVTLTAGGTLTTNTIDATATGTGTGGAVNLTFAGDTDTGGATTLGTITTTSTAGTGGAVQLNLATGTTAATLVLPVIATGGGGVASGAIAATNNNPTAGSDLTDANAIDTTGTGTNSAGGNVTLTTTKGAITLTNTVTANGTGTGKGGNVLLSATGGKIDLGTNAITTNGTGSGAGGNVTLTTDNTLTTGAISALAAGAGAGGIVQTTSVGTTTLGTITTTSATGPGGNVSVTLNNPTVGTTPVVLNLPTINTRGGTAGGNIVAANKNPNAGSTLSVTVGLDTSGTGTNATGGNVQLSTVAGNLTVGGTITTDGTGTGNAGTVQLTAGGGTLSSGAISAVGVTGNGGDVILGSAGTLDPSSITTSSTGGTAGDVTLTAPTITLDNPITATGATAAQGGTITLNATTALNLKSTIMGKSLATLATGAGPIIFNDGSSVTTTGGGQTYGGAVTLDQTAVGKLTTLADTGSGNIRFSSTVDSDATTTGQSLTVTTLGNEIFGGAIGSVVALNNLTTDAVGTAGGLARFIMALPATTATNLSGVNLTGTLTTYDTASFAITGTTATSAPSVSTGAGQSYAAMTLAGTAGTLTRLSGTTIDSGTVTGNGRDLTVTASTSSNFGQINGAGALIFNGAGISTFTGTVGATSLNITGGTNVALNGGSVTTSAGQTYAEQLTLGADTTLSDTGSGTISLRTIITDGTARALTTSTGGTTTFGGTVGTVMDPLSSLTAGLLGAANLGGTTQLNTTAVFTNGAVGQIFNDNVTLGATPTLDAGTGPITFARTLQSAGTTTAQGLTATTTGTTTFKGQVGGSTLTATTAPALANLTVSNDAQINATSVTTTGAQSYGTLTLGGTGTTTLASTGTGGSISSGTITGGGNGLTVNVNAAATGASTFADINNAGALTFTLGKLTSFTGAITATGLNFNTPSALGMQQFSGGTVTTSGGGQTYRGNTAVVQLAAGLTLADTAGGAITLPNVTSTGAAQSLTVTTAGTTTFGNTVGSISATTFDLSDLTVGKAGAANQGGTVRLNGGTITTTGAGGQIFNDKATLGADTTLGAGAGPVTFALTLGSDTNPHSLAITTTGTTTFGGAVGGPLTGGLPATTTAAPALASLTINGGGPVALNGGSVTTLTNVNTGTQTYSGQVTLGADTVISGYSAAFNGGITETTAGTYGLTLNLTTQVTLPNTGLFGSIGDFSSIGAGGVLVNGDISTYGSQTYSGGAVVIATGAPTNVTFQAGTGNAAGSITLNSTLDEQTTPGLHNVTLLPGSGGSVTIGGAIGATHALGSLTAGVFTDTSTNPATVTYYPVTIKGVGVTTTGSQSYGNLTLGGATNALTTLTSNATTGANFITANSVTGAGHPLTVNVASANGTSTFGPITGAGALNFGVGGTATFGNVGATTVNSTSKNTVFNGTVNATDITVTGTGATLFGGAVNATSLSVSGGTGVALNGGTVNTTAAQTYSEAVTLGADTTLASTGSGDIAFTGTIRSPITGGSPVARTLTVNTAGVTKFGGAVGDNSQPLASVTTNALGSTQINGGSVETTGAQTYNDKVTLGATTTLTSDSNGDINFVSTLDSDSATTPRALTVNTGGTTIFGGLVGATALASITTDAQGTGGTQINGGGVTTTGAQTYGDALSIGADAILKGTNLSFPSFTGNNHNLTLTFSGTVTANNFNGVQNFTSNGTGSTILAGNFSTSGFQDYETAVTLSADSTLTSTGGGAITFAKTVGGAFALTLGTSGIVTFGGAVGTALTPLTSVKTTGTGEVNINGGAIFTNGVNGQYFTGPVLLGATGATPTTTLTASGTNAPVFFGKTIQGKTGTSQALEVVATGLVTLTGAVGTVATPLASFKSSGAGEVDIIGSSVITNGAAGQFYQGNVVLGSVLATPLTTLTAAAGPIDFEGKIDGKTGTAQALTLSTTGTTTFTLGVGTGTALSTLITATGPLQVNGGAVDTTGTQTYNGAVTLGTQAATFASSGTGVNGDILFNSKIDGAQALTVNTAGTTTFTGAVGGDTQLTSVTTDALGSTVIKGGVVSTTGGQTYNDNVTLASTAIAPATTTLTAGADGIDFVRTLDGNADGTQALVLTTTGTQTFGGLVGATHSLASLTTSAAPVEVDGGGVKTTGAQIYNGALTLGTTNATFTTTGTDPAASAITFNSTVGGPFVLTTATAGGNTVFGKNSGSVTGSLLTGLTTSVNGTTIFNNAALTTNGTQNYQGPVVVQSDTRVLSLTASTGNIVFAKTLNSIAAFSTDLTLTTSAALSSVTFTGAVGGGTTAPSLTALNSLKVVSPRISIDGGVVNTASTNPRGILGTDGTQNYNGAVFLGQNTVFVGTTVGATGIINAQGNDLTLTLSGLASVPLVDIINVHNFTSNGTGGTAITGSFQTTGFQHYANAVSLNGNATLTAGVIANQDSISFDKTVGSPGHFALTLTTSGPITFSGVVGGGTDALGSLATTGTGVTNINGGAVTTVNGQSFAGAVVLGPTGGLTTLTSTNGGTIKFGFTLDGDAAGTQALVTATDGPTGTLEFDAAVGGTNALKSITANGTGTTHIDGGSVTTTGGGQTYNGPVVIDTAAATTLKDTTTGNIKFGSTLDNTVAGTPALTLTTGGNITFVGQVGNTTGALGNLVASAGGTTFVNGGLVISTGSQTYNKPGSTALGAVSLGNTATFTSTGGGDITFHAKVDGTTAGAQGLTVNTAGNEVFEGIVGGIALASLTTDGGAGTAQFKMPITATDAAGVHVTGDLTIGDGVLFGSTGASFARPSVLSGGSQSYSGGSATHDVFLVGGGTFGSTGTLDFGSTNNLSIRFGGQATVPSGLANVHNFFTDGIGGTLVNGTFTTTGTQTYSDAVTLAGTPILTSVGALTFNNPVDGAAPLTLNATGPAAQVVFNAGALVGNTTPIGALTINSTGGTVFGMDAGSTTIGTGKGGVNAASVNVASGPVVFGVTGATDNHPSIQTIGTQTYQGAATLQENTFLKSTGGGAISFSLAASKIDSALTTSHALTLITAGAQTFAGLIGSTTPLSALTTGNGVTNFSMTVGNTDPAGVRINGPLITGGAVNFNEAGSSLTRPSVLTLNSGAQTYGGVVTLLGAVTVLNSADTEPTTGTFLGGGTITFSNNIVAGITAPELDVRAGVGMVVFKSSIYTTGDFAPGGAKVVFGGAIGTAANPLGTFTVQPNGGTSTDSPLIDLNGSVVVTGGLQSYAFPTVLSADTTLTANGGNSITFGSTLNGSDLSTNNPYNLTINVNGGTVAFNGIVGGIIPLQSLTIGNTGATIGIARFGMDLTGLGANKGGVNVLGAVTINTNADFEATGGGGTIPTILSGVTYRGVTGSGTQTYGQSTTAAAVTVGRNTILRDLASGAITFNGRVNAAAEGGASLSVNTGGDELFQQLVGNVNRLSGLSTDDQGTVGGTTRFNMDLSQAGVAAGVRLTGVLGVNDRVAFNATPGAALPTIQSGGAQNYALAATVRTNTVLTAGGDITFADIVDSGSTATALTVNSPGNEIFKGLVGNNSALASLTTDATGPKTGQTQFLMTRLSNALGGSTLGGVNVNGNVLVNDGVLFRVGNTQNVSPFQPSVFSGGSQTYVGAATLAAQTVLVSSGGSIAFNSTVDSNSLAAPQNLTISTPVNTFVTFGQAVGRTFPLATLDIAGGGITQINGGLVSTTLGQQYEQAVTLGQDTTLLSSGANTTIGFSRSLDGSHDLTITAPHALFAAVGNEAPLLNLTINAPLGATFSYNPALVTAGNADVNVAGTLRINGPAYFAALNTGGVVAVRTGVPVAGFTGVSAQIYNGPFTLQGTETFTDLRSGDITFGQTVDGPGFGSLGDLTASTGGTITFNGAVGATNPLTSLTTSNLGLASGLTVINGGSVRTVNTGTLGGTGTQTYNDAVILGAGTTLTSVPGSTLNAQGDGTIGGDIVFNSTVNSNGAATPQALTVNTSGRTVFGGAVGAINALASVTTDNEGTQDLGTFVNGGSIKTTGAQTYNDAATLGAATTLTSTTGGKIAFASTLDSNNAATPQALTVNTSGRTVFGGAVGAISALASVTTDNEGTQDLGTFINGGSVKTTGAQTYNDGVEIGAATTLTSTAGGDVVFNSTLDSNTTGASQTLVVNTSGRTVFGGVVGAANALASITTDNEGNQDQGTFLNGGSVTTTGAQTYNDAVTLGANAALASRANGTLVFNNTVNGAFTLTANTGGLTIFNRAVGGVTPLTGLTTDNAGVAGEGTQFNMTVGNNAAGVVVNGPVRINDAVLFNVKGSSLTRPGILTLGNNFGQAYNGPATLGTSTFLVSAAAPAVGGVFTGGGSIRFNSPQGVVADGGTDLTVRAGVGTDTVAAALNVGVLDLGGASATFLGPVTLPGTLSVEPNDANGGGSIAFTGATVTTIGAQLYNAAFVLGADAALTSTAGGSITFASTVDGAHALSVNTAGDEIFNARVGGITPLASLITDDPASGVSGGHVIFNVAGSTTALPSVTTTGLQTYNDAALLRADTVLASTSAGILTFRATVDSYSTDAPRALTLNTASDERFNGQVGGTAALLSLTTDDPAANSTAGRTIFNLTGTLPTTPTVTTVGAQTYNDSVLVQTDTTFASTGGGALTFVSALDGPAALTLDTTGTTKFGGAVGSGISLASLTTQGGGAVAINGGSVTTTGLQTYGGVVTVGADTALTSTATGGGIAFARTVDSATAATPRTLTLNAVGDETFNGRVGSIAPLASLSTDDPAAGVSGGSVVFHIDGSTPDAPGVTTIGAQTYNDAARLQLGTVLASNNGGTLTFTSTVDGPFALTLNTTGDEVFGGNVGSTQALASLITDANLVGGRVIFGLPGASGALTVTTVGLQTFNDAVLLQTGTTLTSNNGGTLTFASTINGPFSLSLNSKGDELFFGQIGHDQALASLSTDADAKNTGGNVRFFFAGTDASPSVTTTGAQAYRDPAVLHANTVLASTGGGRLAFLSTVDNNNQTNAHDLTLNTSGDELFGGLIGAAKAIGDLTVDSNGAGGGQTQFAMNVTGNAAGVNVNGAVTINDAVFFNAQGVTGNNALIRSTGAQTYNGPATLGGDAFLVSSGGGAVTFNSTIDGQRNLTLDTGGVTTFNGAIGSDAALASLTSRGGPVTLNAGVVNTTGAQLYSGAVTLGQDTTLTSSGDGIGFGSTVDGEVALTLATTTATTFEGAVGGKARLTNLTATDGSAVVVNGSLVATSGLQTYGGIVVVNGADDGTTILQASNPETSADVTQHGNLIFKQDVTVNSGSLLVQGRRILAQADSDISVAGAGNLDLEADDVLILRGSNYGSVSGNVILNDPQNGFVPDSANRATIFLTNARTVFHGGNFDMGYLQNMFSLGAVSINVGGTAMLSDIAASGSLNVTAGSIVLRARNADPSRGGAAGGADDGLNFVSRTSINFGNTAIRYDNAHSTNDVANFVTTTGLVTVNRDRSVGISLFQDPSLTALFQQINANTRFSDDNFGSFSAFPFQPISGGTQTIDTAAALSGALPDQKPLDVAVDITVTAGQLEELKKLGIHPRRAARQEKLSLNSKRALFAQLVDGQDQENYGLLQPIKGGISRLVPSDYVVVVDRMSEREVQSILTAFEELYGKNKEKAAPIGESFNTAFTDYTTEKQTGDPAGFGPYLLDKPGKYPDVDKAVRGFDNLFGYIESLGLTSKEQAKSKEHIASDLQVAGVAPEDMVKVIDSLRAKIPKAQKAPSTKLPPSPPATAPAPGATNPPPPAQKATPPLKTARQPGQDPTRKTVRHAKGVKEDRRREVAGL